MPNNRERWTPERFVAAGSLCPDSDLRDGLREICQDILHCQFGLLLVFAAETSIPISAGAVAHAAAAGFGAESSAMDPFFRGAATRVRVDRFFQSLAFCYHEDSVVSGQIRSILREPLWRRISTQKGTDFIDVLDQYNVSFDELAILSYGITNDRVRPPQAGYFSRLKPTLGTVERFDLRWRSGTEFGSSPLILGLLSGVRTPRLRAEPDPHLARAMSRLYIMASGSAAVQVSRGVDLNDRIDEVLESRGRLVLPRGSQGSQRTDHSLPVAGTESIKGSIIELSKTVVKAATAVTRSSVGSVYLADTNPSELACYAQEGMSREHRTLCVDRDSSVVTNSFQRRRPFLINNVDQFREMHAGIRYLPFAPELLNTSAQTAELAVPLLSPHPDGRGAIVFGVINVEKQRGEYSSEDLAALRLIAQHFISARSQILANYAFSSLAAVTAREASATDADRELLAQISSGAHPECGGAHFWPIEFTLAKAQVRDTLRILSEVTRSEHITLRLVNDSGRALIRFVEWPEIGQDEFRSLPVKSIDSVNAWVFRNGRPCYLPKVNLSRYLREYPGLRGALKALPRLASELCLPIFVQGRLVGALDLESSFEDSYALDLGTIGLVLEMIRLLLRRAQRVLEEDIVSRYTALNLSVHEILKCQTSLDRISKQISKHDQAAGKEIQGVRARLESAIEARRALGERDDARHGEPVYQVIQSVIDERSVAPWAKMLCSKEIAAEPFPNATALRAFCLALGEVIDNAFSAIYRRHEKEMRILVNKVVRGHLPYLQVSVDHSFGREPPERWVQRCAYRVPVRGRDRVHYGAFLAGALLRSAGGDVRMFTMSDSQSRSHTRTVIDVPWLTSTMEAAR